MDVVVLSVVNLNGIFWGGGQVGMMRCCLGGREGGSGESGVEGI